MFTDEELETLVRTGPGTTMGQLFRRYWVPVALSERVPEPGGAPLRVRILSEDLVLFRGPDGSTGLMAEFCPHRRASLAYARNEEGGLRCIYHGWKFSCQGEVLETPPERRDNLIGRNIQPAYPTVERAGLIWAYMGPAESQPPFPDFKWMNVVEGGVFSTQLMQECNYLQGIDGDLDPHHANFLHADDENRTQWALALMSSIAALRHDKAPRLFPVPTEYGVRTGQVWETTKPDERILRVHEFVGPCFTYSPVAAADAHIFHAWVPIDDENHWLFQVHWHPTRAFTADEKAATLDVFGEHVGPPDYRLAARLANNHLQDREKMANGHYSGISGVVVQDMAVQASMGPIADRRHEHLGTEDKAVIAMRRSLLDHARRVAAGEPAPGAFGDYGRIVGLITVAPADSDWDALVRDRANLTPVASL